MTCAMELGTAKLMAKDGLDIFFSCSRGAVTLASCWPLAGFLLSVTRETLVETRARPERVVVLRGVFKLVQIGRGAVFFFEEIKIVT